ncbi:ribonuclease H-like domain-containing protein [Candidatus Woesearchaeota archaeon]|nr:ribonuclease H-like domain-containing protein [Candidatus Woesearchaeota archaeon]
MITNTFTFLDGIGRKREQQLWQSGITDWNKFLDAERIFDISTKSKIYYDYELKNAKKALLEDDSSYFARKFPSTDTWRLFDHFRDEAVYLDIEATGVGNDGYITLVGLYDGNDTKTMVKDINLDVKRLAQIVSQHKLMITFNGSSFDLPMLAKKYPVLSAVFSQIPHIDLRHLCAEVGLVGGLKKIEREMNIKRNNFWVERLHGGDAAQLWRLWSGSKDEYYLKLLIEYNEEDIINLKQIMVHCYNEMKSLLVQKFK